MTRLSGHDPEGLFHALLFWPNRCCANRTNGSGGQKTWVGVFHIVMELLLRRFKSPRKIKIQQTLGRHDTVAQVSKEQGADPAFKLPIHVET